MVLPRILASSIFLVALAPLARAVSPLAFLAFAIVALVKFLRETSAERTADQVTKHLAVVGRARERARPHYPCVSDAPVGPRRDEPYLQPKPDQWSLSLLQAIEWKRFEEVVAA